MKYIYALNLSEFEFENGYPYSGNCSNLDLSLDNELINNITEALKENRNVHKIYYVDENFKQIDDSFISLEINELEISNVFVCIETDEQDFDLSKYSIKSTDIEAEVEDLLSDYAYATTNIYADITIFETPYKIIK